MKMTKSEKIMQCAIKNGIQAATKMAESLGFVLFTVDVGPGSAVEVWNKAWTKRLERGMHVSRYGV